MRPTPNALCVDAKIRRVAFTLIEVLVVVAVIALLIAIILPSLAGARRRAQSTVCLANLEQQAKAAFMYAQGANGQFPSCRYDAIEKIPWWTRKFLIRMVSSTKTGKGGADVFYCPSNDIPRAPARYYNGRDTIKYFDIDYRKHPAPNDSGGNWDGALLYWWLANPDPQQAEKFWDTNNNGTSEDEILRRAEQKFPHRLGISTDQSRQSAAGWYFFHGRGQQLPPNATDTKGIAESWKNTAYGDGHAESVPAFKVIPRWGPNNPAGW